MRELDLNPQFVIVIGGAGSGKNYFIEHDSQLSTYKLVDVDAIKGEIGVSAAITAIKPMLLSAFANKENVVHPTTASNLTAQKNKINAAKSAGYTVTLILRDTPVDQALAQVRKRVTGGGHDVDISKIVSSNTAARNNFNLLSPLVDASKIV